ncbi:MAG TPA: hypothetical protein VMB26_13155 [Candidatus Binataceae bacterium]|nr:hypothetical protein [Candidatus Binataceae bacterium]
MTPSRPQTLLRLSGAIALTVGLSAAGSFGARELNAAQSPPAQSPAVQGAVVLKPASQTSMAPAAQSTKPQEAAIQVPAGTNKIANGSFAKGAGDSPDHWRTEGWEQKSDVTSYTWIHESSQPAELEVDNSKPNDARWMQAIDLEPGWYYLGAQVRTEGVGQNNTGASVSIMEDGAMSHDVRGTTSWHEIGFYLKIGSRGGDIEIALRVGGYASLNTGRAFFRDVKVIPVKAPAEGVASFELDTVRKESAEPPVGQPWTLAATFVLLAAISYFGWNMFANPTPAARQERIVEREQPKKSARQ